MVVHIYCDSVGERQLDGGSGKRISGPYMVAYYLFKALKAYGDFDFHFHTNERSKIQDPQISQFCGLVDGQVAHVMSNSLRAEEAQEKHTRFPVLIFGPNVLFNCADGDICAAGDPRTELIISRESRIAQGPFNVLLFPGFWHGSPETLNRRLQGRSLVAFPCGIEAPKQEDFKREPVRDFLILSKGSYSEQAVYRKARALADQLSDRLSGQYSITRLEDFEHSQFSRLVGEHRVVLYTSSEETQGLARLEASALRPVVVRDTLPYQAPELAELRAEYSVESYSSVAVAALSKWRRLADESSRYVQTQFSLRRMYENYRTILRSVGALR